METLARITGGCLASNGLVINRHNEVVQRLAAAMREVGYTVDEEMRCVEITRAFRRGGNDEQAIASDSDIFESDILEGGEWAETEVRESRRVDIFEMNKTRTKAFVLDPTIRFESTEQAVLAALEKKRRIYTATIPDLRRQTGVQDVEVVGVWFGTHGTMHRSTVDLFHRLGLGRKLVEELSRIIMKHTSRIIMQHVARN